MVELAERRLDQVFRALAHPTRRAMVKRLERGPCSVTQLAAPFDASLAAVSKHLRVLEDARMIRRTWEGTTAICSLDTAPLRTADEWIAHYRAYWTAGLDRLAKAVEPAARRSSKK